MKFQIAGRPPRVGRCASDPLRNVKVFCGRSCLVASGGSGGVGRGAQADGMTSRASGSLAGARRAYIARAAAAAPVRPARSLAPLVAQCCASSRLLAAGSVCARLFARKMIICLSGFVIAGYSGAAAAPAPASAPASVMSRNDIVSCAAYAPQHQQLLQQFGARGRCSSSSESVSSHSASPPPRAPPVPPAPRPLRVRTLYACLGESEGELSFEPNQIITDVTPSPEPGWLRGTLHGRSGLVPENYVEPLP